MSSVVCDSHITLKYGRTYLLAAIQLAVSCSELYFARCYAVKRTGTSALNRKVKLSLCVYFNVMF